VEPVALLVQRQVGVPEHDRVGVGEAAPQPVQSPAGRPAVVRHHDPRAGRLDDPDRGQTHPHVRLVDVAVHGVDRRPQRLEQREHLERDEIPGVEYRVRGAHALHARLGDRPRSARQVRVADDRELHDRSG
jgi:hypothetical protein